MVIGIDAGVLSVTDERLKVGVYRFVVQVLRELGQIDNKNVYRLYSFDPIDMELMRSFGERMENRVLWPVRGWASVRLPLELNLHPVDLFLGVSQMVPRGHMNSIGFLYDLGYLTHPESYKGSYEKLKKQTEDLVKRSGRIITISKAIRDDILANFTYDTNNISVAYPAVDPRFHTSGRSKSATNKYFLFVGSLKPGKNIPGLLAGFSNFLKKVRVPYDLYLAGGEYWRDPAIDQTIRRLSLGDRVKRLGVVSDEELPEYFRGAVAFVSVSFHEGFCLPALEAMACGCPVIGSTDRAMMEVAGDAGMYVAPNDPEQLSLAMYSLAYNAKKRAGCKEKGLKRSKRFSWKSCAVTIFESYNYVAQSPK